MLRSVDIDAAATAIIVTIDTYLFSKDMTSSFVHVNRFQIIDHILRDFREVYQQL